MLAFSTTIVALGVVLQGFALLRLQRVMVTQLDLIARLEKRLSALEDDKP
jgi:hypothetical protein